MALRDMIEEARTYIQDGHSARANEQDTKEWFISPILRELGWVGPNRLASESRPGQERTRMDYSLLGPQRKPLALIEAKASRRELADEDVTQMLNYDFHQAGVDICVLTNGIAWWLYLPRERGNPVERRFAVLDLESDDVTQLAETLESCLQYETLTSGAGAKRAKELLDALQMEQRMRSEIPLAWQRLLDGPSDFLVELLQEEVEDATGLRPSRGQVVEVLENYADGKLRFVRTAGTSEGSTSREQAESRRPRGGGSSLQKRRRRLSHDRPPRAIRLWGEEHRFTTWVDLWLFVASEVFRRHEADFYERVRASNKMRGRTRVYIQESEEGMYTPVQIPNSPFYAETNNSKERSEQLARDLLEAFGYSAQDLEIVAED